MEKKKRKPQRVKPHFYAHCYVGLHKIARKMGYNLLLHGSMGRDLDLVAVAWIDEPVGHLELIEAFCDYLGVGRYDEKDEERKALLYCYSKLPGGRSSYVINLNRGGSYNGYKDEQWYLDISFTPLVK